MAAGLQWIGIHSFLAACPIQSMPSMDTPPPTRGTSVNPPSTPLSSRRMRRPGPADAAAVDAQVGGVVPWGGGRRFTPAPPTHLVCMPPMEDTPGKPQPGEGQPVPPRLTGLGPPPRLTAGLASPAPPARPAPPAPPPPPPASRAAIQGHQRAAMVQGQGEQVALGAPGRVSQAISTQKPPCLAQNSAGVLIGSRSRSTSRSLSPLSRIWAASTRIAASRVPSTGRSLRSRSWLSITALGSTSSARIPQASMRTLLSQAVNQIEASGESLVVTDHVRLTLEVRPYRPLHSPSDDPLEQLRGSLLRYDHPFDPVAEGDWEALARSCSIPIP